MAGADRAATRINATLQRLDDRAVSALRDCPPDPANDYARDITVTLGGPTYVALLISEGGYCSGAAHPWRSSYPLIFDRMTGAEVDPLTWLPPPLHPGRTPRDSDAKTTIARFRALTDLYIRVDQTHTDCHEILRDHPHGFDLWPDAASQSLVLQPTGLAHVFTPCLNPVAIPLQTLRNLHFSPRLLDALAPS